jgi:hypothetical protein
MKGSICYHKQRKYYYVSWLHKGKRYKIYRYNGEKIYHPEIAKKLVCAMQWDVEHGFFRIEKYTKETPTDVMPYMKKWLGAEKANLSPATYKDYLNSITNHLVPWFKVHPVQLHEIRYDTLCQLLGDIKRTGKGKLNVIYCLHRCLDYEVRAHPLHAAFPGKIEIQHRRCRNRMAAGSEADQGHRGDSGRASTHILVAQTSFSPAIRSHGPA